MAKSVPDIGPLVVEVEKRIDRTLKRHALVGWIIVAILVTFFLAGMGLVIYGTLKESLYGIASGGVVEAFIIAPVARLIRFRGDDIRLAIIPALLPLLDHNKARELAALLVQALIDQVSNERKP
jgi:hypothetical protein